MPFKSVVVVPEDTSRCRNCKILMPIPGISALSKEEPELCSECAGEGPPMTLPEIHTLEQRNRKMNQELTYTEEDVTRWARLRREGRSYDWISANDPAGPSYPTVKKYLEKHGYDSDGRPTADAPPAQTQQPNHQMPEGWGKIEKARSPQASSIYHILVARVLDEVSGEWQRLEAPSAYRAQKLARLLRDEGLDATGRTIDDRYFAYFRSVNGK